ncbi:MAG: agmatine deiminase family protein [Saprospiraceae bacterium]|nr:agmatine deiminase family protein [Saprospiraceae bacterium]
MLVYNDKGISMSQTKYKFTRIYTFLFAVCLFLFQNCRPEVNNDQFYMPAEFEQQDAVWMGCGGNDEFRQVRSDIVKELLPYVQIRIISQSDSLLKICKDFLQSDHINTNLIQFDIMKDNEFWIRDHGATFVVNKFGKLKVIDFEWANYGYDEWLKNYYYGDEIQVQNVLNKNPETQKSHIDSLMGILLDLTVEKSWIKLEGGMIEVNGKGTMLLNEPLTLNRNKGATKQTLEAEFERVLGTTQFIWLQDGLVEDPQICQTITKGYIAFGTGGHIDEYARFSDPKTILLAWVSEDEKNANPINQMNYERMHINYQILKNSRDVEGHKFKIIKVPLPDPIIQKVQINKEDEWDAYYNVPELMFKASDGWKAGDTANRVASASYLNYFISNQIILLPTYIKSGSSIQKENQVKNIFVKAFPNRKIVFINALPLNWRGGGIHCATQQQPSRQITP